MGVKNVIVKVGKDGAYFSEKGGKAGYSPAFPVGRRWIPWALGNGFAAGVISALAEGESLEEATFRGNVIGAIQITNRSDNEGLPTREELSPDQSWKALPERRASLWNGTRSSPT